MASSGTDIPALASLVTEINTYAQQLLQPTTTAAAALDRGKEKEKAQEKASEKDEDGEKEKNKEKIRQRLVQAAEKLVIASRRGDENLYGTATNVCLFSFLGEKYHNPPPLP